MNSDYVKILLCDGHNLAFRAFYGIRELSRSDGFPTNMVHGWIRSFWKLEDDLKPSEVRVFFDKEGSSRRQALLHLIKRIEVFHLKVLASNLNGLKS